MWKISKVAQDEAIEIVDEWKYPEQYSFYNLTKDIEDYNERTLEVYQRNEFSVIGESHMLSNGWVHRFIHMEKEQ